MDARTGLVVGCLLAGGLWVALSALVLVGRTVADRRSAGSARTIGARRAGTLVRRASGRGRGRYRWARARALVELGRSGSDRARPWVFRRALRDADPEVRAAALRGVAPLAGTASWALELVFDALRNDRVPRSRAASYLDHLHPHAGRGLEGLLEDERGQVRYWGAMLLARYPGVARDGLERCLTDDDPAVRRAAVETLGFRGETESLPLVLSLLTDEKMFVRAHACRAAGRLGGAAIADRVVPLLSDREWWVRTAAKDVLTGMGETVLEVLVPVLSSDDRFARNGAAEVLQNIGLLDRFAMTFPGAPIVETILAAGEGGVRRASAARIAALGEDVHETARGVA